MNEILEIVNRMDPEKALDDMEISLKAVFQVLSEESRSRFLLKLVGDSPADKVSSLVHL